MLNIRILFNQVNLVLMHETIDIWALFDEASAQELSLAGLKADEQGEDDDNKIVRFMWAWCLGVIEGSHHFIHQSMNRNQFEHGTWHISYVLKPS